MGTFALTYGVAWRRPMLGVIAGLSAMLLQLPAAHSAPQDAVDPLDSPMWQQMHERFLSSGAFVFDERVKVSAPQYAEDSLNVPVAFDASALEGISEIVVFSDLNPLPLVLRMTPVDAAPSMSFRFKLQQSSPIRVAALDADGLWHVGSQWIGAAGGGCTAPSVGMASGNWTENFGAVSAGVFATANGSRLKLQIMHPMDTGLADGIPRFHIEYLQLKETETDRLLAELQLYEPISENPLLSFDLGNVKGISVSGYDNNANTVAAQIP